MSSGVCVCCRRGVRFVTSSKVSWKILTTALCCAWTVRRTTQRRTPYLVRLHLTVEKTTNNNNNQKMRKNNWTVCLFLVFSHQSSVLCRWNRSKQRRLQQHSVHVQKLQELAAKHTGTDPVQNQNRSRTEPELTPSNQDVPAAALYFWKHVFFFFSLFDGVTSTHFVFTVKFYCADHKGRLFCKNGRFHLFACNRGDDK